MAQNGATTPIETLENERAHLLVELAHLHKAFKSEVDVDIDEGDPELLEHDLIWSLMQIQERKLNALDMALQQARQGKYGICERCGNPIDTARLEALPEATLCIRCQRAVEQHRYQ